MNKSRKVFKYSLKTTLDAAQERFLPEGANIVHVGIQGETTCLWAEVDERAQPQSRLFHIFGTGQDIPENAAYRGTVQMPPFVWHIYELP